MARQKPPLAETANQERHAVVQYALLEQPRPGNRETRMRETAGTWLERSDRNNRPEGSA